MGYAAGHRPGPHHRIEGKFVFDPGAECGGNHIKQAANNGRTRFQTGQGGCLSGDLPADFGRSDNRRQGVIDFSDPQPVGEARVIFPKTHVVEIGLGNIALFTAFDAS